jgi:flavin reductase (DIM6/NTAB) family NADH-FMN oxidoreductase RutF
MSAAVNSARRGAAAATDELRAALARFATGVPLLENGLARFICTRCEQHAAGDHVIFIARVEHCERTDGAPLVFHAARFRGLAPA